MRLFAGLLSGSSNLRAAVALVALGAGACSDDAASPTAEGTAWKLSSTSGGLAANSVHNPAEDDLDYKVSCKKGQTGWTIKITDPGRVSATQVTLNGVPTQVAQRTTSTLLLTNVSPGVCTVSVDEGPVGGGQAHYLGQCGMGCTIAIQPATSGFDFQGTLACTEISALANGQKFSLGAPGTGGPIALNLANCN
jgi:hypothetical protein